MKQVLFICLLLLFCHQAKAQAQLALLSKTDAEKAAAYIRKQPRLYLYCGCCFDGKRHKLRPESAVAKPSGTEGLYEVVITYIGARSGTPTSESVDLAYTWVRKKFKFYTVGTVLKLAHDPCKPYKPL